MGLEPPAWRLAETAPGSLVARRFYDEGVRALNQGDLAAARRLLHAALKDDSTLAMAAYYLTLAEGALGHGEPRLQQLWKQAARMAGRAPDQERLFIMSAWANANMDPVGLALAETLVVRYPRLPDAHYQLASALLVSGDALGALPHLREAVAMDSAALGRGGPRCVACDALHGMVNAYWSLDSLQAAERVARDWSRLAPDVPTARMALAASLERQGRADEALRVLDRMGAAYPPEEMRLIALAFTLRGGDFERVDGGLRDVVRAAERRWRFQAHWWLAISLRMQGRLREALDMARAYRALGDSVPEEAGAAPVLHAIPEAVVLLELGRYREAAALFDSIAAAPVGASATYRARHRTWHLTHQASALYLAGDTAALRALADSVEAAGRRSGFGRDRVLHHYVRALVPAARGAHADAVAEYRQYSVPYYGLAEYRLAEALLALGRPREAIAPLRRVLGGPLEAGNLYVSFTAVRELLGRAYEAAGDADSALVQYRWVETAWRRADPEFAPRVARVRERIAARRRPVGLRPGPQ
jgi:tetratricopeptide (TPR) repeat protein